VNQNTDMATWWRLRTQVHRYRSMVRLSAALGVLAVLQWAAILYLLVHR
jgi:hypothetical protein